MLRNYLNNSVADEEDGFWVSGALGLGAIGFVYFAAAAYIYDEKHTDGSAWYPRYGRHPPVTIAISAAAGILICSPIGCLLPRGLPICSRAPIVRCFLEFIVAASWFLMPGVVSLQYCSTHRNHWCWRDVWEPSSGFDGNDFLRGFMGAAITAYSLTPVFFYVLCWHNLDWSIFDLVWSQFQAKAYTLSYVLICAIACLIDIEERRRLGLHIDGYVWAGAGISSLWMWMPLMTVLVMDAMKKQSAWFRVVWPVGYVIFVATQLVYYIYMEGQEPLTLHGIALYSWASGTLQSILLLLAGMLFTCGPLAKCEMTRYATDFVRFPVAAYIPKASVSKLLSHGSEVHYRVDEMLSHLRACVEQGRCEVSPAVFQELLEIAQRSVWEEEEAIKAGGEGVEIGLSGLHAAGEDDAASPHAGNLTPLPAAGESSVDVV